MDKYKEEMLADAMQIAIEKTRESYQLSRYLTYSICLNIALIATIALLILGLV